ncbi:MAG TPA: anthranilate synthase component I family protein [Opitutus sp.]|nr:anthranilate synthase component I family protein [Opitutus sp.]
MRPFSFADWRHWQQQGCTRLPAVVVQENEPLPARWNSFADQPASVLLESAQTGRYSYLCDRPSRLIFGEADRAQIWSGDGAELLEERRGSPLDVLASILAECRVPKLAGWPAMTGGLIGVFGYDIVRTWERLPVSARRDLDVPLFAFLEPRELFIYDHVTRRLGVVVWREPGGDLGETFRQASAAAADALVRWRRSGPARSRLSKPPPDSAAWPIASSFSPEEFQTAVLRVKDYIAAGHTYQVNLSRRSSRATGLPPEAIYEALRGVNPSPYMGLLRLPAFSLVCGSPELLVKLVDGVVSSRPIAGTRPRGDAPPEDLHLSAELFASPKERAEHLMLVDLIRNDIGRVATYGSVHVPEFMALERYSHVMHIVSQVEGRLASGRTWVDVLRAMFPGGTITGCPKVRTMEIIEELEPVGRGFYTGALGWISYGGEMEMNIVIRSMLVQNGMAHVQAGAGIVADSIPARELDEAARKAQALWVALDRAEAAFGSPER